MNLPEGWTEELGAKRAILEWGGHGAVTISLERRGFVLGIGGYIPWPDPGSPYAYTGRGWKDRLYADAIKALQDLFAEEKAHADQA